ncbi:leucine-rich repeat and coiled-coil domain-containing protein 1 [Clupea harengus]|uniref:Leucine-rich repeat and coiled-coil domain-containing protein 1 n=1 Tax=Clupea harengus TaxID=7950 RepID=A0A6P8F4J7_CLUHA|nr:leucine-rich repeat and coiled-coil domain-containing protein 1 [Clupea harengus]XP_031418910.1 leucine-rich repeat and coiled-coil domain-containing protein 1 [Clupea harengus]
MADKELCLIDKNISSLLDVPLNPNLTILNLHCNHIPKIEGLTEVWQLRHLDLSSNRITQINGLGNLSSLRTLNLSCNLITKVEGLDVLINLTRLNLSYNRICDLTGLLYLHGSEYQLKHLQLHGNRLDNSNHLLQCMVGLQNLKDVTLTADTVNAPQNPVCALPGYRDTVLESLQQVFILDGVDRFGNPGEDSPTDIPGLEDFLEHLLCTDTNVDTNRRADRPRSAPQTDDVLAQFGNKTGPGRGPGAPAAVKPGPTTTHSASRNHINEQRIKKLEQQVSHLFQKVPEKGGSTSSTSSPPLALRAKRDTDLTSESDCDSGKENRRRSKIPKQTRSSPGKKANKDTRGKPSAISGSDTHKSSSSKFPMGQTKRQGVHLSSPGTTRKGLKNAASREADERKSNKGEEETYRAIVEERDQERERRWKAEQAVRKLTEQLKSLQTRASEEKDLQSMALHTTERLKELLLKERSERSSLQARVEELEDRRGDRAEQLELTRSREDQLKRALRSLEDQVAQAEALRAQQQAEEMKRCKELENRAAALKREVEILRATLRQQKDKVQQLHELLVSREQIHRKELESRLLPDSAQYREALGKEVALAEQRHEHTQTALKCKLEESRQQYAALEDEFRMALTIEAARFNEVKTAFDHASRELAELKASLAQSQQQEQKSVALVQELTTMVREQKDRIAEVTKSRKEAITDLKSRIQSLEEAAEKDRSLGLQVELLKKDKARLVAQVAAQESVIDGLRSERKLWGHELAQQGASLAQDRGRLEAKIEVLSSELETQKKQNERDSDGLRIKAKIVDDQTDTIRKLKEAQQERDEQLHRQREEGALAERRFQQRLKEETAPVVELRDRLEQLSLRKEELKQQLEDKEAELEEVKEAYRASNNKWQEKAGLLSRLETQVKRMKEHFDSKEKTLLEERDKALQGHKGAVEKLRNADDAFRRQLETLQASHQTELLHLINDKQKQIELANHKVIEVEEEMRHLLEETENTKRMMEEKMRRLTSVLKEF